MKWIPFYLPVGHILTYDNGDLVRRIRFEEHLGDGILKFRYEDGDEELVRVPREETGSVGLPTVEWALRQFRAGCLNDPGTVGRIEGRAAEFLELDRSACMAIDELSGWRFDWADAAIKAGIKKTEEAAEEWIRTASIPGERPKWRSLLRWVRKLSDGGGRIGALVNRSGREKGQSQLSDVEDRLVHKWAMRYWRPNQLDGRLAHKEHAASMMIAQWDDLKALGIPFLGKEAPSPECMRVRINSLECYSTWVTRYGRIRAEAKFEPSGEPVPVEKPFERIYVDGTEFEHSVFYSEDIKIPAAKMKSVVAMDVFTSFVFPHSVFAGPFRPEMGIRAIRNVMVPPTLSEELLEAHPEFGMFYAMPSEVMIDRDRTLLPPSLVPGALQCVDTVELAEAYHSDAKSELENYHKFVKQTIKKIPGRILGPRNKHDARYNPLKWTEVMRAQYVDAVEQCRLKWNSAGKLKFGWRSPNDLMADFCNSGAVRLADPKVVMRTFSSTPAKKCELTTNGLVYDNVRYRWNREGVKQVLSSNYRNTPFGDRLRGTAKVFVTIRTWEDDIDMIEVYDEENRAFHRMYSTEPAYTNGLSRWEHHQYQKAVRSGRTGGKNRRDRAREASKHLEALQKGLGGMSFREREAPAAMLEGEERRLSGKRASNEQCAAVPELYIPMIIDPSQRQDDGAPPPQTRDPANASADESASDVRSNPADEVAKELGGDDPENGTPGGSRWDFDEDADDEEE